jgi:hypothetical protein
MAFKRPIKFLQLNNIALKNFKDKKVLGKKIARILLSVRQEKASFHRHIRWLMANKLQKEVNLNSKVAKKTAAKGLYCRRSLVNTISLGALLIENL